jgi:hypothetical protein
VQYSLAEDLAEGRKVMVDGSEEAGVVDCEVAVQVDVRKDGIAMPECIV